MNRRVAVVGLGGVFPTCSSLNEFEKKIFSNQSLIREWPSLKAFENRIRSNISGFITLDEARLQQVDSDLLEDYPETYIDLLNQIPTKNLATADIGSIWAMRASLDAIKMADWKEDETRSEMTGVTIGSGGGGHEILHKSWHNFYTLKKKTMHMGSHNVDRAMVYRDAANVACLINSRGICESIGSACACGLGNIGHAYRMIKFGLQDRMIAGGTEATSLETFLGFDAMRVLSKGFDPEKSSRPFDKNRNGFVCSFGCGIVALEAYDVAKARNANILAVIDSYFNNSDGDGDMFAPCYDGQMRLWEGLKKGTTTNQFKPDVVKVHGTSTPSGDVIEIFSVTDFLGDNGYYISAPKSQYGHMLGAAGAVEFINAVLMIKNQKVSPCLNANELNDQLEPIQKTANWKGPMKPMTHFRHLIPTETTATKIDQVVCLNYGFGGTNSSILISKE